MKGNKARVKDKSGYRLRLLLHFFSAVLGLILIVLPASDAFSSGFTVTPVRVSLSQGKTTSSLTVTNISASPVLIQLETFLWEQSDEQEKLTKTADLLAVPTVFTLEAGKSQIIRVAHRRAADPDRELTYRLFITEVKSEVRKAVEGVNILLQHNLPVFVEPKTKPKPRPEWTLRRINEKQLLLSLANKGNVHMQPGKVRLFTRPAAGTGTEALLFERNLGGYALAGGKLSWKLDLDHPLPVSALRLVTEDELMQRFEAVLSVEP